MRANASMSAVSHLGLLFGPTERTLLDGSADRLLVLFSTAFVTYLSYLLMNSSDTLKRVVISFKSPTLLPLQRRLMYSTDLMIWSDFLHLRSLTR